MDVSRAAFARVGYDVLTAWCVDEASVEGDDLPHWNTRVRVVACCNADSAPESLFHREAVAAENDTAGNVRSCDVAEIEFVREIGRPIREADVALARLAYESNADPGTIPELLFNAEQLQRCFEPRMSLDRA